MVHTTYHDFFRNTIVVLCIPWYVCGGWWVVVGGGGWWVVGGGKVDLLLHVYMLLYLPVRLDC